MSWLTERSQRSKENPYSDWHSFYIYVIPSIRYSPYKSIEYNLAGIGDRGHWSQGFAQRLESIYEIAAGTGMRQHRKEVERLNHDKQTEQDPESVKELKQHVRRGLTLISYYLRAVNKSIHHEKFDLDLFQHQFTKIYAAYGSETTRWFCLNYADVLEGGYDPAEYVSCIDSVAEVGGRESISIFSAGFRPLMQHESYYDQRTEPVPFASAINRVIEKTGSRWYALTFALSAKYAQAHQIGLDELEARVTSWGLEFDSHLTKKMTDAFFEFYRVANHDSEYDFAALETDVRILMEKFDSKVAGWFIDGVVQTRRAKERGLDDVAGLKSHLNNQNATSRDEHEQWRSEMLERTPDWGIPYDIPAYDEYIAAVEKNVARSEAGLPFLTPEHFREVFANVLDDLGRQAAYVYANADFGEFNGYSFIDLDKIIQNYIDQVGQRFAKRSLWLLSKISSGSPESLKKIIPQVISVVKTEGEKVAHEYLKYSYGARRRGSHAGLIKPGEKKIESESKKVCDQPPADQEPPPIDDPWTDYEFDSHSVWEWGSDAEYEQ